jgi:valyl-tRNA synthetase
MNSDGSSLESTLQRASSSVGEMPPEGGTQNLADRWILSRLNRTASDVNKALTKYEFHTAVSLLYHFFWDDFCDWYIELKKDEIIAGDVAASSQILSILEQALRLLHPFMPYLTEELWQKLPGVSNGLHNAAYSEAEQSIMLADFPKGNPALIDESAEAEMNAVIEVISKVRNIRSEMSISPSIKFTVHLAADADKQNIFRANEAQILKLARAERIVLGETLNVPKASAKAVTTAAEIAVPLEGLIDFEKERARLSNQIDKLNTEYERLSGQLSNESFVSKAPPEKVAELRERKAEIEQQVKTLNQNLEALG